MESRVQAIGISMLIGKRGANAEACFAIKYVGVQRAAHQRIHRLADQIERIGLEDGIQNAIVLVGLALKARIGLSAAGPGDERWLKDRYVVLRIIRKIYELVLLLRIEPEQSAPLKCESAPAHHISDRSPHYKIQLQLHMVMAFELWWVTGGLYEVEEAVVTLAQFQVFEHMDKIR